MSRRVSIQKEIVPRAMECRVALAQTAGSRILRKEYAEDKARGQKSLTRDCVRKRQLLQR